MIYNLLINLITANRYQYNDMMDTLDVFFTFRRITAEEYSELIGMITPTEIEE